MTHVRVRVAAYVVRAGSSGPELLVFDHAGLPKAGRQVPAGGVKAGESVEDAVRREVAEETGLADVTVRSSLGMSQRPHPRTGAMLRAVAGGETPLSLPRLHDRGTRRRYGRRNWLGTAGRACCVGGRRSAARDGTCCCTRVFPANRSRRRERGKIAATRDESGG
jgi:ADP-ribose pyrophosphatase YjhB (NUDIX family)